MGLADHWEIADLHCLKVECTKWLKHKLRAIGRSGFSFLLRFAGGRLEFVTQAFGDSPKLSSSGLAVP